MRAVFAALLVVHGLIHFMGFAKAFGFAELPQLRQRVSRPMGVLWLVAGLLILVGAFLPWRAFWVVGLLAVVASQAAIVSSWADAKFGTLINVVALAAVVYAFAARGPASLAAEYAADVARALRSPSAPGIVTEADLQRLPQPVQNYLRVTGAVGQPRPSNVRARWKGRIRGAATDPWMGFTAEQFNTYGPSPSRLFLMDATMKGLPVDVFHRLVGDAATFRVRLLSLFPLVDAKGPEMNRSETVTLFNDMCMLAPGALADPAIRWDSVDALSARVTYTRGPETISAELRFAASGMLVDFISDDRSRASPDGNSFTRLRWTTPVREARSFGPFRLVARGEARWHAPDTPGFAYVEMELLDVAYNVAAP
jgi:hypothetical protein